MDDRQEGMRYVRVRTYYIDGGRPEASGNCPPDADRPDTILKEGL